MAKFNVGEIVKKISLILILLLSFSITRCVFENIENENFITKNAYNDIYELYKDSGLSEEEINKILVLDVKPHEYFTSKGYGDEHSGCNLFAYEEDIMNWVLKRVKS